MNRNSESGRLLEVRDLSKHFRAGKRAQLKAVDRVSFSIDRGETLGLVGESGCGKTTCGRTILGLYAPTSGRVVFDGQEVSGNLAGRDRLAFKRRAQMIFQDPYSSLDPRMTIGEIVTEGMGVHFRGSNADRQKRTTELLAKVGLTEDFANRFAHELSGGQRQRVGIARALAVDPEFIVCDEPISALDVSIQSQVLNLLLGLQKEDGLTYLFISHDLSVVRHISDRVGVMYLGSLVEIAATGSVFERPLHPYTTALLSAVQVPDPDFRATHRPITLRGEVPSPINPPSGCKFRTRCSSASPVCAKEPPELVEAQPEHFVACHHWNR